MCEMKVYDITKKHLFSITWSKHRYSISRDLWPVIVVREIMQQQNDNLIMEQLNFHNKHKIEVMPQWQSMALSM